MTVAIDKQKPFRWLLVAILLVLAAGLSYAVLSLPAQSPGLTAYVAENIKTSGVSNPVTAVLLNFRAYDTLLEMGVLLLALLGTWSLSNVPEQRAASPGPVLDTLSRLLLPLLILVAGYLLWAWRPCGTWRRFSGRCGAGGSRGSFVAGRMVSRHEIHGVGAAYCPGNGHGDVYCGRYGVHAGGEANA